VKLAIFGGTFDPIHEAHLAVAREAANRFCLDRVLFVPAAQPPHKQSATLAPYEDRVHMVQLACRIDPRFEVSRLEQNTARSYSIDTVEKVSATLAPGDELYFLIGADAFAEITTWHRWRDVARAVRFLVVSRPGHHYAVPAGVVSDSIADVDLPFSSSEIRDSLVAGRRPEGLPQDVYEYSLTHNLYR
jgi:nicotinate-nucleotide adenylyltransferase